MTSPIESVQPPTHPPMCSTVPVLGELPVLLTQRLDRLERLQQQHGDIFTLNLGFTKVTVLCHPRHAQHVLRDHARIYSKANPLWDAIRGLIGNGLPTSEGDFWLRQRRMMQPHFHRERLTAMVRLMIHAIDEELVSWEQYERSGRPIDLFREMTVITMRVIVRTMFGSQLGQQTADMVGKEMGFALDYMMLGMLTQKLPKWFPVPGRKRFTEAVQRIDRALFDIIDQRKRDPNREGGELLSMMLDAVDTETQQRMTAQELRDEAVALFLAGYETTSSALSFAFDHLRTQPQSMKKLEQEILSVLQGREPEMSDLRRLPYTLAVIQEALRLHGPVFWIPRTAEQDDVIDGYRIPNGQEVAIMVHTIHRHPQQWSRPHTFDPERFSPDLVATRHPLAWIPFGAGQRICIGKEFALMEGQLILARILSRYEVIASGSHPVSAHIGTTLRPKDGVWVTLRKRTPQPSGHATAQVPTA